MQQMVLLHMLLHVQHVSGTTMPIISSSRVLYSGCRLLYFAYLVGILFPHINDDARSKSHQIRNMCLGIFSIIGTQNIQYSTMAEHKI